MSQKIYQRIRLKLVNKDDYDRSYKKGKEKKRMQLYTSVNGLKHPLITYLSIIIVHSEFRLHNLIEN